MLKFPDRLQGGSPECKWERDRSCQDVDEIGRVFGGRHFLILQNREKNEKHFI